MAGSAKKKGGKGLMIGLVLLVVVGGAGAFFGLAMTGKINIPGITPKKKPIPAAAAAIVKPKPKPVEGDTNKAEDPKVAKPLSPAADRAGAEKVAEVWDELPADKLIKISEKWKPTELAAVLSVMDPAKVAELLAAMPADKASIVSRELRNLAAQIPAE